MIVLLYRSKRNQNNALGPYINQFPSLGFLNDLPITIVINQRGWTLPFMPRIANVSPVSLNGKYTSGSSLSRSITGVMSKRAVSANGALMTAPVLICTRLPSRCRLYQMMGLLKASNPTPRTVQASVTLSPSLWYRPSPLQDIARGAPVEQMHASMSSRHKLKRCALQETCSSEFWWLCDYVFKKRIEAGLVATLDWSNAVHDVLLDSNSRRRFVTLVCNYQTTVSMSWLAW